MQSSKRAYRIFPAEVMKFTADYHFQQHHTRSNLVYILVLLLLIFDFISLIFIQVDVSVSSQGILTASTERNTVKSPINGRVREVFVRENLTVQSGDILLTLISVEHMFELQSLMRISYAVFCVNKKHNC